MSDEKPKIEDLLTKKIEIEKALKSQFQEKRTVMFTDIKGSTSYFDDRGDIEGVTMIHNHNETVFPIIARNNGRLLQTIGDGTLSTFEVPADSLRAAKEIHAALSSLNQDKTGREQVHVRIGLHYGDCLVQDNNIFGDVVNVASRMNSVAKPDEVILTEDLYNRVKDNLDFVFKNEDRVEVKGKRDTIHIYKFLWRDEDIYVGALRSKAVSDEQTETTLVLEVTASNSLLKFCLFEKVTGDEQTIKTFIEKQIDPSDVAACTSEINNLFNKAKVNGFVEAGLIFRLRELGAQLADKLLPPEIREKLAGSTAQNLLVSIEDSLVHIPWELLHFGNKFLCLRFGLGRAVKTSLNIQAISRQPEKPLRMLMLTDPVGDLAAAQAEGHQVYEEFKNFHELIDINISAGGVTRDHVLSAFGKYDILHYAGHAEHITEQPEQSAMLLKDGKLTAQQIINSVRTGLMPSLIFFNACQTGRTEEWQPKGRLLEGTFGLANAFLLSGVNHYIGTLWEMPEESGLQFAVRFYRELFKGSSIGSALKQARMSLIETSGESSIVWASYILYGDPSRKYITIKVSEAERYKTEPTSAAVLGAENKKNKSKALLYGAPALAVIILLSLYFFYYSGGGKNTALPSPEVKKQSAQDEDSLSIDAAKKLDALAAELAKRYRENRPTNAAPSQIDEWAPRKVGFAFIDLRKDEAFSFGMDKFEGLLAQKLQDTKRVNMVERGLLDRLFQELKLSSSELADPATALKLGRLLSAKIIVTGRISAEKAGFAIMLKCLDTETSQIRKTVMLESPAKKLEPQTIEELSSRLVEWLKTDFPLKGRILSVSQEKVTINLGQKHGLRFGDNLSIFESKGKDGKILGRIQVESVRAEESEAVIIMKKGDLKQGFGVSE